MNPAVKPATAFHCSADWHLLRLGKYAAPIHALMLRVQDEDFFGSVAQMAEYFHAGENSIRRPLRELKELGFVTEVASRSGESTIYRAVPHKEWAETHPGRCCVKENRTLRLPFDTPSEMERVQNVPPSPSKTEGDPCQNGRPTPSTTEPKSPRQFPKKFPDIDATTRQKDAAPVAAIKDAYKIFCQEMNPDTALDVVLWILYRAASVKSGAQIPQSAEYYRQAKDNLIYQHEHDWERLIEDAERKFCKHAYFFVEEKNPELIAWLKGRAQEIKDQTANAVAVAANA